MQHNNQPVEKQIRFGIDTSTTNPELDFHSMFKTIQGEGPFAGRRAVFVRLAGCNLQCPECDTEYTEGRQILTSKDITKRVNTMMTQMRQAGNIERSMKTDPVVVITGGEPLRQPIHPLVNKLLEMRYDVQIETNGTLPPHPDMDDRVTIVCSPKGGKIHPKLERAATCYKYVVTANSVCEVDGLPVLALSHPAAPKLARPKYCKPIYIQPADLQDDQLNKANLDACVESAMKFGYTVQVQLHKLLGVE